MLAGNFPSELKIAIISSDEICERVHSRTYGPGQRLERKELPLSGQRKDYSYYSLNSSVHQGNAESAAKN